MTHQRLRRHVTSTAGALTLALALSACGGAGAPTGTPVTVTVTPTVTAAGSSSSSKPAAPTSPRSDVVGRDYDFGTVAKVSTVGATTVLELDRWTWKKLDDAELAREGVPTEPFKGKAPYTNQNTQITFTIPVADGARVLQHHCVALDQPLQTKSVAVEELADLGEREDTVLVQLDAKGRLTAAQNIPGCPG
jgi:hypothetical protein